MNTEENVKYVMSPLKINILLYYYAHADDFPDIISNSQVDILSEFISNGIIEQDVEREPIYKLTDRGVCYVEGIIYVASQLSYPKWSIKELHGKEE